MTHTIKAALAAIAVALPAALLGAGVAGAHGGEAHPTSAADAFSHVRELGLVVTAIVVGIVLWLSNRGQHDEPPGAEAAGRARYDASQPEIGEQDTLARTPVRAAMTDLKAGPAPEAG